MRILYVVAVLGVFLSGCDQPAPSKSDAAIKDKTVSPQSDAPSVGSAPSKPATKWSYSSDTDKMRGTVTKYARLESENELQFGFPYDGGTATLLLRSRPEDGLNVLLQIEGQFICHSYSNDTIAVKFDEGPIRNFGCSEPQAGGTGLLFIDQESRFVTALKRAKTVIIEAQFYQSGRKQMEFDVRGLNWD